MRPSTSTGRRDPLALVDVSESSMKQQTWHHLVCVAVLGVAAFVASNSLARANLVGDLYVGGNYTGNPPLNYTFAGSYDGGGGSIDTSYLNGYKLPWVYCTDIPDNVWVPGDYKNTLISKSGQEWWGGGNPISGFVTVPHAGSVAYLLATFGNAASAIGRNAEAGLQAAIWQVIYFGYMHNNQPLFQYVPGSAADTYYNTDLAAVENGHPADPSLWRTANVNQVLWFSPSNDPLISSTHASSNYIYQGLVTTAVPEPSSLVIATVAGICLVACTLFPRRSAQA
jgi:hypothetical protein